MTEPTETAEARRLITEAVGTEEQIQAEAGRVLDLVQRAATAFAAGDIDTAGALLVEHTEQDEDPDQAAYTVCLAAVTGVGYILDGDLIQPPCHEESEEHGGLLDLAVHAVNHASLGHDENLYRILGTVWDGHRDKVLPLAVALISLLAGVLALMAEDGDRDA